VIIKIKDECLSKDLSSHFTEEDFEMAHTHMERFSTLLALGKFKLRPQ
jgi:hypothetical protein